MTPGNPFETSPTRLAPARPLGLQESEADRLATDRDVQEWQRRDFGNPFERLFRDLMQAFAEWLRQPPPSPGERQGFSGPFPADER